jgi:glycosyltransferase involved in cell wall biosynthesis
MMHIGIDGGCWTNRRGYGRFLRELLDALAVEDRVNRYSVFLDAAAYPEFRLGQPFRAVRVGTRRSVTQAAHAGGRRSFSDLLRMSRAVAKERLDLFFFPSVYSWFPLPRRVPTVTVIHDTVADRNPELAFDSRRHQQFWRWKVRLAITQARTILTVSEYSMRCLQAEWKLPPERIRVLYEAASPRFLKIAYAPVEPYILYVGGISPNKNLATLVRAFARVHAAHSGLKLILAGDYQSDGFKSSYAQLRALIEALGLGRNVVFTGYVPDDELCLLYNGARAFVMPSLDEGFGLPALEAMACGTPVIASSGNALEEIAGGAALLVDPHQEGALASAILSVLEDPLFAAEMSRRALERAAQFSWSRTARELMGIFRETARQKEAGGTLSASPGVS